MSYEVEKIIEERKNENSASLIDQMQNVEPCKNQSVTILNIVLSVMDPYFQGNGLYEDCLAELQSTLELYLYE